eukprot:72984-Chlamydomonas_euryale.AAC.7
MTRPKLLAVRSGVARRHARRRPVCCCARTAACTSAPHWTLRLQKSSGYTMPTATPKMPPQMTWRGVCPSTSCIGVWAARSYALKRGVAGRVGSTSHALKRGVAGVWAARPHALKRGVAGVWAARLHALARLTAKDVVEDADSWGRVRTAGAGCGQLGQGVGAISSVYGCSVYGCSKSTCPCPMRRTARSRTQPAEHAHAGVKDAHQMGPTPDGSLTRWVPHQMGPTPDGSCTRWLQATPKTLAACARQAQRTGHKNGRLAG